MNRDETLNRLLRLPGALRMRGRLWWWRQLGARIAPNCWVQDVQLPRNPWDVQLSEGASLDRGVVLLSTGPRLATPRIIIGRSVYINRYTILDVSERIEIGDNSMIGPHCFITDHDHGHERGSLMRDQKLINAPVVIGSNVWIGAGVMILKGVSIGDEAVIGAGSVVTRDVEAGAKVVGVPARLLGKSLS